MISSPTPVTDTLSNIHDQIANGARLIGRSKDRQMVFEAIYRGKKQLKTIDYISQQTGLSNVRVLQAGGKMAGLLIDKVHGAYKKRKEFSTRYKTILALARDKKKLAKLPTKISPTVTTRTSVISVSFPTPARNARLVTVDDMDSFSAVVAQGPAKTTRLPEKKIKGGFACIIGEKWTSKDWGGEKSDLFSTKIRLGGKRLALAIAFKGKGTRGKLVPAKMGKNGDQINRLFEEPAQVFLVVYCGPIDSSILAQMRAQAIVEALKGRKIYYGVIDGQDLARLRKAYSNCF